MQVYLVGLRGTGHQYAGIFGRFERYGHQYAGILGKFERYRSPVCRYIR